MVYMGIKLAQTFQVLMMHPRCCRSGFLCVCSPSTLLSICIHKALFILIFIREVFELFILPVLKATE